MHVNKFLGRTLVFDCGIAVGFSWIHSNGYTSKTSALLFSIHPKNSITWTFAMAWTKPQGKWYARVYKGRYGYCAFGAPFIGGLDISWQPYMERLARS